MESTLKIEVTPAERDLLLEGLRFIRSSRKLAFRDRGVHPYPNHQGDLRDVATLYERLEQPVPEVSSAPRTPK